MKTREQGKDRRDHLVCEPVDAWERGAGAVGVGEHEGAARLLNEIVAAVDHPRAEHQRVARVEQVSLCPRHGVAEAVLARFAALAHVQLLRRVPAIMTPAHVLEVAGGQQGALDLPALNGARIVSEDTQA